MIASDSAVMNVLNQIEHTPRPNMLLAGVQFLMMRDGVGPELASHYPSLGGRAGDVSGVGRPFRDFVLTHREVLIEIGRTRYTQTNECRRCAVLLPAIWETSLTRFHLIDLGASAGLNLLLDRYRYEWDTLSWGIGPLLLRCESRGRAPSPRDIEVVTRTGLDLNPIDPLDGDDRLWLDALIWPEHAERRRRLREALDLATHVDFELIAGSALETLGDALHRLPPAEAAVVMTSFTLNQLSGKARDDLSAIIADERMGRRVVRVSFEQLHGDDPWPKIVIDEGSGPLELGQAHPHGEWLELYALP